MVKKMQITIDKKTKNVNIIKNIFDEIRLQNEDIKLYQNKTSFNTFLTNNHDYIIINNKNAITHIYRNLPKYKYIKVMEDIKNTSILVLPKNTSIGLKIGDVLNFN